MVSSSSPRQVSPLKLQQSKDSYVEAIETWLSGETTGHLGPYMYTGDADDHRWKEGHCSPKYYLGTDDKLTLDLALHELDVTAKTLFDLGPGGDASVIAKSIPLAKAVRARRYFPIDLSETLARNAAKTVGAECKVYARPIVADFFAPPLHREPNGLVTFMGGTVANIETHQSKDALQKRLTSMFANFADMTCRRGHFLLSFDANQNAQEILDCYENPQIEGLIRGGIDKAISTEQFAFDVVWSPQNYQLALGLRSKQDQVVRFNGGEYSLEKGEFLSVLNSYRFPVDFVKEAAANAGWSHRNTWSKTGRVHYLLFS